MSPPGAREKTAPGRLELVQRFVNTADLDRGEDELDSQAALVGWLAQAGLVPAGTRATTAELERALEVREGLRAVLGTHTGTAADPDAMAVLDRAADHASLRATFVSGAPELSPSGSGVDAALAHLLAIVTTAAADGTWQRLRACADQGCRWAFYDHSKNRSGRWCSMAVCGNQHKARSYRQRARAT